MEEHRTGLSLLTKKQLLDVVRLYNAEKRIPITFRMPLADILKYLTTDKSIDHTLLEKAFQQIKKVSSKIVKVKGTSKLVPAIVKKAQPKKTARTTLKPAVPVKGRGQGRPAGSTNRFNPSFSNQA
jgi:hypothetical protein